MGNIFSRDSSESCSGVELTPAISFSASREPCPGEPLRSQQCLPAGRGGGRQLRLKFTFNLLASGMGFEGIGIRVESGPWHSHFVETYFRKTSSHLEDLNTACCRPHSLTQTVQF